MSTQLKACQNINEIIHNIKNIDTDSLLIIVDVNVSLIYKEELAILAMNDNKKTLIYKAISGESLKSLGEFEKCINFFLEGGIHRKSHLVAIGGGVTSDFSGYVAASLLRGIKWSIVPTTLLSMVDASIGGKVGLNVECGKNLVGAFHLPTNVWCCHRFLLTLPDSDMQSGKGEMLKYAFLDKSIGDFIKSDSFDFYELINMCAQFKLDLTDLDFKEEGKRKVLNLGHTFGHAIEKHYILPHGLSVIFGMIVIYLIFDDQKSREKLSHLYEVLKVGDYEMPWHNRTFPLEELFLLMSKDKKMNTNKSIDIIKIEKDLTVVKSISFKDLRTLVEAKTDELKSFIL